MAAKCADEIGDPLRIMRRFCMFYRLLIAQPAADQPLAMVRNESATLNPLPRLTKATRAAIVAAIRKNGSAIFIQDAICDLETSNLELLQIADYFASTSSDYLRVMQGFALLYTALALQSRTDSLSLH